MKLKMKHKTLRLAALGAAILMISTLAAAQKRCTEDGSIRRVTKATSGNYETVTFEFVGSSLPSTIEVTNEKPPITNYGGDNLHMKGRAFKGVHMSIVPWTCKIAENFKASSKTIKDIRNSEQFEGYVTYVIGYTARSKYVGKTEITGPKSSKIVIKFKR
ncbi:MAG: hypothetical protein ABJA02_01505 [Acidobacteriota bacterium]